MKKAELVLVALLAMTFLVSLQFSCKAKADPTKPDLKTYWDDNPIISIGHDTWTPTPTLPSTVVVPVNTNTPVPTSTWTFTSTPCSTKQVLGYNVDTTPTMIPINVIEATRFQLATASKIYELGFHAAAVGGTEMVHMGLYTESGASWPLSLIVETGERTVALGTNIYAVPTTILGPGWYWVAVISNAPITTQYFALGSTIIHAGETFTYGNLPPAYPALAVTSAGTWRMWAGYCTPP